MQQDNAPKHARKCTEEWLKNVDLYSRLALSNSNRNIMVRPEAFSNG